MRIFSSITLRLLILIALPVLSGPRPIFAAFTDVTAAAGVFYVENSDQPEFQPPYWQPLMPGGAAAADYDGDGWVDLAVTRTDAPIILFRNLGNGTFADVTAAANLDQAQTGNSSGMAWGDIDNDGDQDLYVTSSGGTRHYLYVNDGNGTFSEEAVARGASLNDANINYGQGVAFGDYDLDGYLDIYVTEWRWDNVVQNPNGLPSHNRLLRNQGASAPGTFVDTTDEAGVNVDRIVGDRDPGSWAFTPRFADLDGDGHPDLVIAADFEESVLFWNNGNGTFTDGTVSAGVSREDHGMGGTTGDFNGDGLLDWFVTSIFRTGTTYYTGNRMYYNNGDRTFTESTDLAGVRKGYWGWGTTGLDYDNDGDLDLLEANG